MFESSLQIGERARHVLQIAGLAVALLQPDPESRQLAIALAPTR